MEISEGWNSSARLGELGELSWRGEGSRESSGPERGSRRAGEGLGTRDGGTGHREWLFQD